MFRDWIVSSQFICWSPNPECDSNGERAFRDVIKVKWGQNGGAVVRQDRCPVKKRKKYQGSLSLHAHRGKATWGLSKKAGIYKPRKTSPQQPTLPAPLSQTSKLPELWENKSLLFKPRSLWHFVMASWGMSFKGRSALHKVGEAADKRVFMLRMLLFSIRVMGSRWWVGMGASMSSEWLQHDGQPRQGPE